MKNTFARFFPVGILFLIVLVLSFFIKGDSGSPLAYQHEIDSKVGGPFESTNSTSRYVLTQALAERGSVVLSKEQARAAAPDVAYSNGKFFSLFTPGVSFVAVPFYLLGKLFGTPQLTAFLSVAVFSFFNCLLLVIVGKKVGLPFIPGLIGGLVFLFATNGLSYSMTMTQHQMTVTCILLAVLLSLAQKSIIVDVLFGAVCGFALLLDIPNGFLLLPVGLYFVIKHFSLRREAQHIRVSFNAALVAFFIGLLPLIFVFAWYNTETTGSPTLIAQTVGRTSYFDSAEEKVAKKEVETKKRDALQTAPLKTRYELSSLYVLLLSDERSWLYYSPVVLLGVIGLFLAYRKKEYSDVAMLLLGIASMNIAVYAMFGDPWGGWSFGPRYLIPAASVLSIGVAYLFWRWRKNIFFLLGFIVILLYSITISSLGALTTNAIPPKVEAVNLQSPLPYTYEYNIQLLNINQVSSLLYNLLFVRSISGADYLLVVVGAVVMLFAIPISLSYLLKEKNL